MLTLVSNILTSLHKTNENWTQKKCRIKNQFPGRKNDGKKKEKDKEWGKYSMYREYSLIH